MAAEQVSVSFRLADLLGQLLSRCVALRTVALEGLSVWLEHRDGLGINAGVLARSIRVARAAQQVRMTTSHKREVASMCPNCPPRTCHVGVIGRAGACFASFTTDSHVRKNRRLLPSERIFCFCPS
jgi:hypothetical protein